MLLEERPHPLHRDPDAVGTPDGVGPHHGNNHPDRLTGLVDDRPAAVTGIDIGVEQERSPVDLRLSLRGDLATRALQFEPEQGSARVAEHHDLRAAARHRLGQRHRRSLEFGALQEGEIGVLRRGNDRRHELLFTVVRIEDHDIGSPFDDMGVGENVAGSDHETGPRGDPDDHLIRFVKQAGNRPLSSRLSKRPTVGGHDRVGKRNPLPPSRPTGPRTPSRPCRPRHPRRTIAARATAGSARTLAPLLRSLHSLRPLERVVRGKAEIVNRHPVEVVEFGGILVGKPVPHGHPAGADGHPQVVRHGLTIGEDFQGPPEVPRRQAVLLRQHLRHGEVAEREGVVRLPIGDDGEVLGSLEIVPGHHHVDEAGNEVGFATLGIETTGRHQLFLGELHLPQLEELKAVLDHVVGLAIDLSVFLLGDPLLPEATLVLVFHLLPARKPTLRRLPQGGRQLRIGQEDLVDLHRFRRSPAGLRVGLDLLEWIERSSFDLRVRVFSLGRLASRFGGLRLR